MQGSTPLIDWVASAWPAAAVAAALLAVYSLHLQRAWSSARGKAVAYAGRRRRLQLLERRLRPGQPAPPTVRALRASLDLERSRLVGDGILR